MAKDCPVTGLVDCDCGACEPDDDQSEPWRDVRFRPPGPAEAT